MRRRELSEQAHAEPPAAAVAAPQGVDQVLALQRGAGNAAVSRYLATHGPALARTPQTSLGGYTAQERQGVHIDHGTIAGQLGTNYFMGGRAALRSGLTAPITFGGAMAPANAAPGVEARLRDGLANVAMTLFNAHDAVTDPVLAGATEIHDLDLTTWGGQDGRYRFTSVSRTSGTGPVTSIEILVELLGARRAAFQTWSAVPAQRQQTLTARATAAGFTQYSPAPLDLDHAAWSADEWGKVLQALEAVPDAVLGAVRTIDWARGASATRAGSGELGWYEFRSGPPQVRQITLYGNAFGSDAVLSQTVAHEIGHALSGRPREDNRRSSERHATQEYRRAANADGGLRRGITEYARTDWDEHFSEAYAFYVSEADTFRTLRPNTAAYFDRLGTALAAPPPAPRQPAGAGAGAGR